MQGEVQDAKVEELGDGHVAPGMVRYGFKINDRAKAAR